MDEKHSASAEFADASGFSMRRAKLHQLLVDHAVGVGVEFRWGARVTQIDNEAVTASKERLPYRWLIGADGQNSLVRKWAGLDARTARKKRFGFCSHFQLQPWSDFAEVHWTRGCQMFITPMKGREVGVAVLSRDPTLRLERALPMFPALEEKLRGVAQTTRESGDATTLANSSGHSRRKWRIALIGDASGTVDAVTGHGLSLSFQQAISLGEAMRRGEPSHYQRALQKNRRSSGGYVACLMLLMERNSWIRRRTIRLFEKTPNLFSRMIAIHTEAVPLSSVGMAELAGFGWKFLRA